MCTCTNWSVCHEWCGRGCDLVFQGEGERSLRPTHHTLLKAPSAVQRSFRPENTNIYLQPVYYYQLLEAVKSDRFI
jgi:hypothetical protein